jgi:outer membrane protein TolC
MRLFSQRMGSTWPRLTGGVVCCAMVFGTITGSPLEAQVLVAQKTELGDLQTTVLQLSPLIQARRQFLEAAKARAMATGFIEPATLTAEAEGIPGGIDVGNAESIRLDLSREVSTFGRSKALRDLAQQDVALAEVELTVAQREVQAQVEKRLLRAAGHTAIRQRLAAQDSLLESAEAGVQAQFSVGEARYVDVLRLRTERLRVQIELSGAEAEASIEKNALLSLVPAHDPVAAAYRSQVDALIFKVSSAIQLADLPSAPPHDSLLLLSPEAARSAVVAERARSAGRLIRLFNRPSLFASVGIQRFGSEDGFSVGPAFSAGLSLPFTAGSANRLRTLAAEQVVLAADAARQVVVTHAQVQLQAALDRYEAARTRLEVFDAALLQGARDEREVALAAYRNNELSLLELLDFERALAQAEIARIRSVLDGADALFSLLTGEHDDEGAATDFDFSSVEIRP